METKYAFGYVRVSTGKQDELSPDSQAKLLKDYAKSHGYVVSKIFYEVGISGRKADKRPEFQKMIGLAKSSDHPADAILVWKYSRFARNQEESIVYKSLLKKKHNVDVISISEPLVDGPFGSLIERIIEWMDEYYSVRLSGEVTRGMREKAERGGYQARPPLGYKIVSHKEPPVIVPEEAEIVKLIFEKYVHDGMGLFEIARLLNSHNFKTSHGKEFERRSIEYILQNPTYCGMIRWNRTINESNEIRPENEWIVTDGEHPAIISKELFGKAQERYKREYRPRGARPVSTYKHWLSGVVKCPACGRTMTANTIRNNTRVYSHFRCYGYTKGKCMANNSISSIKLEPAVLESIKTVLDSSKITYRKIETKTDDTVDLKTILEDQIKKIDVKLQRIKEAYMNGIDTMEEYKENKQAVQEEKQHLEKQLSEIKEEKSNSKDDDEDMLLRVKNVYDILSSDSVDATTKNDVLRSVVEKIIYEKDKDLLKVYYYYMP